MTEDEVANATREKRICVLFVCMGNICRSPTAEGVFRKLVGDAGLEDRIVADSAGTHDYHVGSPPDERAQEAAQRRGYDLGRLRARQVQPGDLAAFDYVVAMDSRNHAMLMRAAAPEQREKIILLMDFAGEAGDVPDPYYGGAQGFERVLDMIENAAQGLLRHIRERLD